MKLSKQVKIVIWQSKSKKLVDIGVRVKLPVMRISMQDKSDGTAAMPNYGTLASAPQFAITHFQNGDIAIKLNDNWVFVIASMTGHICDSGFFFGFRRMATNVDCVW